jgi:hypothetical protein
MADSKIFSKSHEAYEGSIKKLQIFGIFEKDHSKSKMMITIFILTAIILYPMTSLLLGLKSIENFGEFVEWATLFVGISDVAFRSINVAVHQTKILEIAELFQELKKFDENEIVKKIEISLKKVLKVWLVLFILVADFYCLHQSFFNHKNLYLGWIDFPNEHIPIMIGFFDLFAVSLMAVVWINCQTLLFTAYAQLVAHFKCLMVKFSKIEMPTNAEESKENLEKLHEIIEIHQKLKRYGIQI